jgi:hypothetical protein
LTETIHLFVKDTAFINPSVFVKTLFSNSGSCVLTQAILAAYVAPTEVSDPRTARLTDLRFGNTLSVITDGASSVSDFVSIYSTDWSLQNQESLFNIIDQLCFNYSDRAQSAWNVFLSGNNAYSIYVPGSLSFGPTQSQSLAYINGAASALTIPDTITLTIGITINTTLTEYQIVLWTNTALFLENYPISTITAVTFPLTFTDLLNQSIVAAASNALTIAKEASNVIYVDLTTPDTGFTIQPIVEGASGYITYNAKFVDINQNFIFMPFNVLYKGATPGVLAIRLAIKTILLASGVGTQAQWQARIPELFVNAQYYLIPMWLNTVTLPDSVIYQDTMNIATMINYTQLIMFDISPIFVAANIVSTSAAYDSIMLAAVPDPSNPTNRLSLSTEIPQYQDLATTDSNFNLMPTLTKQYATFLNNALPVAAGISSTNTFIIITLNNRTFVTFTVGDVEYYLIVKETFKNIIDPNG